MNDYISYMVVNSYKSELNLNGYGVRARVQGNWWTVLTETFRLIVVNLELEIDWFVVQAKSTSLALYSHLNRFFSFCY